MRLTPKRFGWLVVLAVMGLTAMHGTDAHALAAHAAGHGDTHDVLTHEAHDAHASHSSSDTDAHPATHGSRDVDPGPAVPVTHHMAQMCLAVLLTTLAVALARALARRSTLVPGIAGRRWMPPAPAWDAWGLVPTMPPRLATCVVRC